MSVRERIELIDDFVHHRYYDQAGLMYSHMNWKEERPFTSEDFSAADSTIAGPEAHQWMSYENSAFISGIFLAAQCLRHEATGDPEALEYARRAYGSIDANYRLTEQHDAALAGPNQKAGIIETSVARPQERHGFFCKPYYGEATDHTSTEQHFGPLLGLYHYWNVAPSETRNRIAQIFREVSQRWRARYQINFFSETWNMEESYPRAQRHMFLWSVMHRMAFEITGDDACHREYERLDALYGAVPAPRETAVGLGLPRYISTEDRAFHVQIVIGGEILMALEPERKERYLRGMQAWWKHSFTGQRNDLSSYYFIEIDSLTGAWEKLPVTIKPRSIWRSPFMLHNATLPICTQAVRERQTISSSIIAQHAPEEAGAASSRLEEIYIRLNKEHLKWFVDPEDVVPEPLQWMLNVLQGDALAFYSLGYWHARAGGIPLPP